MSKARNDSPPTQLLDLADGLSLDADYLAGASVALLGKRGSGKTYTCRALAEELFGAAVKTIIIDPMGVFWGLRINSDGTRGGLPIPVFGGEHGDAPLDPSSGKLMANLAVDDDMSMVLDLSGFTSRTQERSFVREFVDRLYRHNTSLVHVIVDEADLFCPQKPRREDGQLLVAMENLVRRGRNRGIGVTIASQRPAVINKDVLTQVDALVAMRVTAPQDRDAIRDWVRGQGDDEQWQQVSSSLPQLSNREAWWWIPERGVLKRVQGRRTRTFDSSPTKTRSSSATIPRTFADVDLKTITARLQAASQPAVAGDPGPLTAKVHRLEAALQRAEAAAAKQTPVAEVREVPVLSEDDRVMLREAVKALQVATESLAAVSSTVDAHAASIREHGSRVHTLLSRLQGPTATPPEARPMPSPARQPSTPVASVEPSEAPLTEVSVPPARQRIIDALADLASIGVDAPRRTQVALWVGASPKSSGYTNNLGALRSLGLIDYPSPGYVAASDLLFLDRPSDALG